MTKRSRFGCQTCKTRRVKCDETLPYCKRCVQSGRVCDGTPKNKSIFVSTRPYPLQRTPPTSANSDSSSISPANQLSPLPDAQPYDRRVLSYFIERAGPALGGELDQDFWNTSVIQLCHQNPMVRNAVLAVSTLYENPLSNPLSWPVTIEVNFSLPEHRRAFQWYSESLSSMSESLYQPRNQEQAQLALTSCILFSSVEFQQLNVVNSMTLMKCGYQLLRQDIGTAPSAATPLVQDVLLPMFIRQTIVFLLHGQSLPKGWLPPKLQAVHRISPSITSLQDGRTQLFLLMIDGFYIMKEGLTISDPAGLERLRKAQSSLLNKFTTWHTQLEQYVLNLHAEVLSPIQSRAVSLLQVYYLISLIWLSGCLHPSEMIYDEFTPQFIAMLDHIEMVLSEKDVANISYTFEMRVIPPLYFTGWHCRIPHIRRRALQLLRRAPVQESLFHREIIIRSLRKIIEVEEGLQDGTDVEDDQGRLPTEEARLKYVTVRWDMDRKSGVVRGGTGNPCLVYSQWALEEDETGHLIDHQLNVVPL